MMRQGGIANFCMQMLTPDVEQKLRLMMFEKVDGNTSEDDPQLVWGYSHSHVFTRRWLAIYNMFSQIGKQWLAKKVGFAVKVSETTTQDILDDIAKGLIKYLKHKCALRLYRLCFILS